MDSEISNLSGVDGILDLSKNEARFRLINELVCLKAAKFDGIYVNGFGKNVSETNLNLFLKEIHEKVNSKL